MLYRILLYVRKLKILNILLVIFISISITTISFSLSQIYKNYQAKQEYEQIENFVHVTTTPVKTGREWEEDRGGYNLEANESNKKIFDMIGQMQDDSRVTAMTYDMYADVAIKEFTEDFDAQFEDYFYTSVETNQIYLDYEYNIPEDFDSTKVYVSQSVVDRYGYSIGDTITIASIVYVDSYDEFIPEISFNDLKTVQIHGILESKPFEGGEKGYSSDRPEYGMVYVPYEELRDIDDLYIYYATISFTGAESDLDAMVKEIASDDYYVYYTKDLLDEDLSFFNDINKFFVFIIGISSIVLVFTFIALNNNIIERRRQELQLYNIFGLPYKNVSIQLILEKLLLVATSLIFAIPASLLVFRKSTAIINTIVEYSFQMDSKLGSILYYSPSSTSEEFFDFYYKYTQVEVSKWLIICITIVAVTLTIVLITYIQSIFQKNRIVEQRRDL